MKHFFIYKITNLLDGKIYIGITSKPTIQERFSEHVTISKKKDASKYKKHLHRAIAKYGADNFRIEQIDTAESKEQALDKEKDYIIQFGSLDRKLGYNLVAFGPNGPNEVSQETREKQSKCSHRFSTPQRSGLDNPKERVGKFVAYINKSGQRYRKAFPTAIEALEGRDKMAIFLYGDGANLNFPSKRAEYLSEDLEEYFRWFSEKKKIRTTGVQKLSGGLFSSIAVGIKDKTIRLECGTYSTEKEAAIARDVVYWSFGDFGEKYVRYLNYPDEIQARDRSELKDHAKNLIANGSKIHPVKSCFYGVLKNEDGKSYSCFIHSHHDFYDVICENINSERKAAVLHDKLQFMLNRDYEINFPDLVKDYDRDDVISLYKRLTGRGARHNDYLGIFYKKQRYVFRIAIRKGVGFGFGGFETRDAARRARDIYLLLKFNRPNDLFDIGLLNESKDSLLREMNALERLRDSRRSQQAKISSYFGVQKRKDYDAWLSKVYIDGKCVQRTFPTEIEAAKDYDRRTIESNPHSKRLNFAAEECHVAPKSSEGGIPMFPPSLPAK